MGMCIRLEKAYKLRSGKLLNIADIGAYYWHGDDLRFQKCAYFLAEYAIEKLKRVDGSKASAPDDYYGEWVLPMKNVQDILSRCNKAEQKMYSANKSSLKKVFNIDGWSRYNGYDDTFFNDISEVKHKLPVVLEDYGDSDVVIIMSIG